MTLSQPHVIRYINDFTVAGWESVRPAPKVTIDFGDGHRLERTLGGNIVLELVLPDGRVVDAFPGVYTPDDLLSELRQSMEMIRRAGVDAPDDVFLNMHKQVDDNEKDVAQRMTLSKAIVESPILKAMNKKSIGGPDLSKQPLDAQELKQMLGDNGMDIVRADSQNNVDKIRPQVHHWFAERIQLPNAAECKTAMYEQILHIPLNDPYLGLAEFDVPGTPH